MPVTDFPATLNRLAGTTNLDAQGAANVLAGTTNLDLVAAINFAAGTVALELNGAVQALAALLGDDFTLDYNAALNDSILNLLFPLLNLYPSNALYP